MLKRAGNQGEKIIRGKTLTIEERDNLIVILSQKLSREQESSGQLKLQVIALQRDLKERDEKIDSLKKLVPATPSTSVTETTLCTCGETARFHRIVATAPNGATEKLGSCMRATCSCRKFTPKV
jgi:hypothetical protein